jgi:multimeric flavodoxin WrbA
MMSRLIPKETSRARSGGARHALLIIGSPKTGASNSEILGNYLLGQLHEKGWETHTVKLRPRIFNDEGLKELLSEVNNCNLIVLAAPLYIDSLPAMVVKVFEKLVENRGELIKLETKRLFAIVNNGFPEAYQNAIALEICQNFAQKMGMIWAGGLALGAGEAVVREQPLTEQKRSGPPVLHVIEALNTTAVMLDQDGQISSGPTRIFVKSPIPMVPFPLWRWMYIFLAASDFKKRAATHGIQKHQLKIKPYAA